MRKKWIWMTVGISLVILTSLFLLPVCAETSKNQQMEMDTNRFGDDFKDLDLAKPNPALCSDACQKEKLCAAWTYVKPGIQAVNARCWLKNQIPPAVPDECCVSGLSKGIEMDTNRFGDDFKDLDLSEPNPALCSDACQKEKLCKAWTYVKPGIQGDNARCWLKNKVPPATPDECCMSGLKRK